MLRGGSHGCSGAGTLFPNKGITLEGLEAFLSSYEREITETTTTSDVCHATVKILTVTPGWTCVATLTNAEKSWYKHQYVNNETGEKRDTSPPGSSSYLDLLQKDPQTAVYVGRPTIFLSHAWTYKFRNLVAALRTYVDALPADAPPPFFWFDVFSIDEHATQQFTQEWWSTTFMYAIEGIGHTLMMLSPWDKPIPLDRAWCLWEMYSTHKTRATFSVCLGPEEQRAFEEAILDDFDVVFKVFAGIDVKNSKAGKKEDQKMIMDAVRATVGFSALNALAFEHMRGWIFEVARNLATCEGVENLWKKGQVANMLDSFGLRDEAKALYLEVIAGRTEHYGPTHTETLKAKENLDRCNSAYPDW